MNKKDFDSFINKQQEIKDKENKVNWEELKLSYLNSLKILFENIHEYIHEYEISGKIISEYKNENLTEEHIGEYSVKVLELYIGNHTVRIVPKGRNIFGAKGRVDLIGPKGSVRIVLVNKHSTGVKIKISIAGKESLKQKEDPPDDPIDWVWKIATRPPKVKLVELNQEKFLGSIMEVIGE